MNLAVLAGLTSVILVMLLGQSRVFFALMVFVASFSAFAPIALVGAVNALRAERSGSQFAGKVACW